MGSGCSGFCDVKKRWFMVKVGYGFMSERERERERESGRCYD